MDEKLTSDVLEILDEVINKVCDEDWKEVEEIENTLRRIFKTVGRDNRDSDDTTDEEEIIAEFVAHRKCNVRCRVRYIPVAKDNVKESGEVFKKELDNMEEMRSSLRFITEHHDEFEMQTVRDLKAIFLEWTAGENDVTAEEFEMYREFQKARDAIRGSSDTEDDSEDEDSETETDTEDDHADENSETDKSVEEQNIVEENF